MSIYSVRLTDRMMTAIVDRAAGHYGKDSPRHDPRTTAALQRRGIINNSEANELSDKGYAYLSTALFEYARMVNPRRKQYADIIRVARAAAVSANVWVQ